MERSAPPKEWKLPPEFILPWEPGVPEEPRPGAEAAPLPPEFQGGGRGAPRNRERRRGWRILASVAMALLLTVAAAVPAAELPSPEPPTSAGDPLPTVPPETTPPGGEESPGPVQTPEPITFFSAMMNGSEGFLQVTFPEPETIASAKVTQFDTITQRPFYEDTFGEGIPRADIDAGLYTAFYVVYPPDFDDYWAEAGADTYPTFEMRLTVERVNGETETYTAADLGRCPQLRGEYDETTNTVTMKVWWDDGAGRGRHPKRHRLCGRGAPAAGGLCPEPGARGIPVLHLGQSRCASDEIHLHHRGHRLPAPASGCGVRPELRRPHDPLRPAFYL